MGYIILTKQLEKIKELTNNVSNLDSVEVLWLPGGIHLTIWSTDGQRIYLIDEDGNLKE